MPEHKNEYSSPEMMINVSDLLKKDSHGNMCIPYQVDIRLFNGKELKAFAKVTYGHIVINDICILQRFGRITIVYPSKRLSKRNGKDVFVSVAFPNSVLCIFSFLSAFWLLQFVKNKKGMSITWFQL